MIVALPGSESMTDLIYQLIPTPEGGLLTTARDGKWREYRDGVVRDYPMPARMPPSVQFPQYTALEDGRVALVSDDGELYLLDLAHRTVERVALDGSATLDLTRANDGGILVISDEATYHVTWPDPIDLASAAPAELQRATQAMADALASSISAAPEQWYSFKPIWPATPEEAADLERRASLMQSGIADPGPAPEFA